MDSQKIGERLAITKERYRVIIEKLWCIVDYRPEYTKEFHMFHDPTRKQSRPRTRDW